MGLLPPFDLIKLVIDVYEQITDGVKPTLSELEKFEDQPEGIDLEVVTESGTVRERSLLFLYKILSISLIDNYVSIAFKVTHKRSQLRL